MRIAKNHARFIALLPRNRYTLSVRARVKAQTAISLYRLLGICAFGASGRLQFACYARKRKILIRYAGLPRHCVPRNDTNKNRRRGNGNTQACVLPRTTLGLLLCSAQPIAQTSHRQKQQAFAYCLVPCLFSQFLRASDTRYQFKQG